MQSSYACCLLVQHWRFLPWPCLSLAQLVIPHFSPVGHGHSHLCLAGAPNVPIFYPVLRNNVPDVVALQTAPSVVKMVAVPYHYSFPCNFLPLYCLRMNSTSAPPPIFFPQCPSSLASVFSFNLALSGHNTPPTIEVYSRPIHGVFPLQLLETLAGLISSHTWMVSVLVRRHLLDLCAPPWDPLALLGIVSSSPAFHFPTSGSSNPVFLTYDVDPRSLSTCIKSIFLS